MPESMIWRAEVGLFFAAAWFVVILLGWLAGKMIDYIRYRREQKKSRRPYCRKEPKNCITIKR